MIDAHTEHMMDYIRDFFTMYSLNDFGVLCRYDEKTNQEVEADYLDGSPEDEKRLEWLSSYIGLTVDEIKKTDEKALKRYVEKYPFFFYYLNYRAESINQGLYNDGLNTPARILKRIFGQQCNFEGEKRKYRVSDIKKRLISDLKRYDQVMPGTYHQGATIENLEISTAPSVISFPDIAPMLSSFFDMVETAKNAFFKALKTDLPQEEILEYNFLVNALQLKNSVSPHYLNYKYIMENREQLLNENFQDFFCYAKVDALIETAPWKCKQFFDDPSLVDKFFDVFQDAKRKMFQYYMDVSRFFCVFTWSDAKPVQLDEDDLLFSDLAYPNGPPLERTRIYVEKNEAELFDWQEHLSKIKKISCINKKFPYAEKWKQRNQIIDGRRKEWQNKLMNQADEEDDESWLAFDESEIESEADWRGMLGWKS